LKTRRVESSARWSLQNDTTTMSSHKHGNLLSFSVLVENLAERQYHPTRPGALTTLSTTRLRIQYHTPLFQSLSKCPALDGQHEHLPTHLPLLRPVQANPATCND
jgi:hypothetical protein